jgi:hypothetical protein
MIQQIILPRYNNKLEEELIKLFHELDLPLHFNKTGNKEFNNYQRISIIILFQRSKKSLRQFIDENLSESKWISWLGLKKIPTKSSLHRWIKILNMKILRKICKVLIPKKVELTSIDSTGIDAWQRSRHYEKRCEEFKGKKIPPMNYAKTSLFVDVKSKIIIDWDLVMSREHDAKIAERIFKRNSVRGIRSLGDKGYDSQPLHEIARKNGIEFYAPPRKKHKFAIQTEPPNGKYRRECFENPPEDKGMRSISETVNSVLKGTQITSLRSKMHYMRERELGWHVILYNIKRKIKINKSGETQTFLFFKFEIKVFWDRAYSRQFLKKVLFTDIMKNEIMN